LVIGGAAVVAAIGAVVASVGATIAIIWLLTTYVVAVFLAGLLLWLLRRLKLLLLVLSGWAHLPTKSGWWC
jgi:hypothetical protein